MPRNQAPLRVVDPGEKAQPAAQNLAEAVERSERDLLVMMRAQLATQIDNGVPAHALSSLSRQLLAVDKEIRQLDAKAKQEAGDDSASPDEAFDAATI